MILKGLETILEITLCSDSDPYVECFPEHKHECRGVNRPTVLPSDIFLAAHVLVKSTLQGEGYVEVIIIISQIRVNSVAVVRMKSVDSYGLAGELRRHPSNLGSLTSLLEQAIRNF
ncbi:uncharacterized protein LOC120013341 [Tripterygium wilfordii]|uniref:uncharacterized protein LOC120013341 n=1 Tax=Tripterygium wilfordii TaxID=458696 RepID=UPI0018F82469|nr:uncharacterized protein LOC120013341 [Tripterygium wilfordii]